MTYEVKPYISVGKFYFGEKPSDIKKRCGAPFISKRDNIRNVFIEYREACELTFVKSKLMYVTLNKHTTPIVNGVELYSEGALERLRALDNDSIIGNRYVMFKGLGICVGGISEKKIPEGKIVHAFSESQITFFEYFTKDD